MDDPNRSEFDGNIQHNNLTKLKEIIKKLKTKKVNWRTNLTGFMFVVIIALGLTGYKINEIRTRAFDIYFGDNKIGTIRKQDKALSIIDNLKEDLTNTYNIDIVIDKNIRFEKTNVKDNLITSDTKLEENIKLNISFLVSAYVLEIDGKEIGAVKTEKEAQEMIEKIKEPYVNKSKESSKIKEVKIIEDIKIVKKDISIAKIKNQEDLLKYIQEGSEDIKTHVIEVGESLWTIAKMYDTSVEELIAANPDKNPERLQLGDSIKLIVPKSMVTVSTVEEVEYSENINYETKIEYNDNMYQNEKKVKVKGEKGQSNKVVNEIKHNGMLVEQKLLDEQIVKEPVTEVVVRGTKEVPKTIATGAFLMPTRGRISSRYGMRNGRMHKGLDIAAKTGTPIKASDGGKVVFAGIKGAYGYMVEIDHGNGYRTRYGHCSKILVKVGTKVYKGQHIANVGNTGRSTGPHLHLEILKNGVNQNPSKFVN